MTNDVSCPQKRRVSTRRSTHAKWRKSPKWKKMLEDHAYVSGAKCSVCGRTHKQKYIKKDGREIIIILTINHTDRRCYLSEEAYLTWDPARMRIECTSCNWAYERGLISCPECLKKGIVSYIRWDAGLCNTCYFEAHPEELKKIEEDKAKQKRAVKEYNAAQAKRRREASNKHPCRHRGVRGNCRKSTLGSQCPHSARNAEKKCEIFESKKVKK